MATDKNRMNPMSLFASAGKKKPPPAAMSKTSPPEQPQPIAYAPKQILDPEIGEMIKRMNEMNSDIDRQIDHLMRLSGLTKEQLWQLAQNPKLISSGRILQMQNKNKQFIEKTKVLNKNLPLSGAPAITTTPAPSSGSRKSKFLGSRRKWISTR